MYITELQVQAIENLRKLIPSKLSPKDNLVVSEFDKAFEQMQLRKKETNARTAKYIAERRKTDKNFARPKSKKAKPWIWVRTNGKISYSCPYCAKSFSEEFEHCPSCRRTVISCDVE